MYRLLKMRYICCLAKCLLSHEAFLDLSRMFDKVCMPRLSCNLYRPGKTMTVPNLWLLHHPKLQVLFCGAGGLASCSGIHATGASTDTQAARHRQHDFRVIP
ncbi:hypothetical protein CUC08_Gglean009747 [Alternaria sp. MG1]|nr:hypothetical protein CUC08_Gglean009747 [Alternaria sp. MG1]